MLDIDEEDQSDIIEETLDMRSFLSKTGPEFYYYQGSLTTPPCSEGVEWVVMKKPLTISLDSYRALNEHMGESNREVQPLNGRKVVQGTVAARREVA